MGKSLIEKLLALKPQGRSVEEIAKEVGEPVEKVKRLLEGKPSLPDGRLLTHWMDHLGQASWQVIGPEPPVPGVAPRAFRFLRARDEAYHRVFIPDDIVDEKGKPAKYIEIFPFSDVHWGHKECDKGNFLRDVKEVERRPNRFGILNGDNLENALPDSKGAAVLEQDATPKEQFYQSVEVYRRIAHKCLVARTGNHEERAERHGCLNPLEMVCFNLGIPYFEGPSDMEVVWRGYRWTFFIKHGTGGSNTDGGQLNNAGRDRAYTDFRNFYIMGHVHNQKTHKVNRMVPRRKFGPDGSLTEFWIEKLKEYKVICPSYLKYDGTYAQRAGYRPGSRNTIVIQLFANGDYHVVSSKRPQAAGI